jgi:hypothetical protein
MKLVAGDEHNARSRSRRSGRDDGAAAFLYRHDNPF